MSTNKKRLTACAPKTAVAYARYSSAQQRDVSIEQQLKDIRAFAEREGYTIIHEYADHAKSGFKNSDRRTDFRAMLLAASTGAFDTVLAWKVDRFGRNRRESAMFKGQLADHGVSVVYAMEPIPDGAAGCLTEGMLEAIAEWYSRNLSENVKRGKRDNATKCMFNGNRLFGYRRGPDGHYALDDAEAAVVRRIFTLYSQGYSCVSIARILNDEGITTRQGFPFRTSTIIYMVTNDSYTGVYKYNDLRIEGGIPAIIDRELFDQCQLLRSKTARHFEKHPGEYLLTGKCICGYCGSKAHGYSGYSKGRKYHYYLCRQRKNEKTCSAPMIRKELLEDCVVNYLFDNVLTGDLLDAFIDQVASALESAAVNSPVEKMKSYLQEVTRKIGNINNAIADGIWTKETASILSDLSAKAESLRRDIAYHTLTDRKIISKDRIRFYFYKVSEGNRDDPVFIKTVINSLINSVTYYDGWLRVVINTAENVGQIPHEELPPLEVLPVLTGFAGNQTTPVNWIVVEPYPVIVFKIPLKTA